MNDRLRRIALRARECGRTPPGVAPTRQEGMVPRLDVGLRQEMRTCGTCRERQFGESAAAAIARGAAANDDALVIETMPHLLQARIEFMALSADDQAEEIDRHRWTKRDPARPRTVYGDMLDYLGTGNQD